MKNLLPILLLTIGGASTAIASQDVDKETLEYCAHKYEQITMDVAYEDHGCKFSEETQKSIIRNRENTYLNCAAYLDDETRVKIGKQSIALADIMIRKFGKENACKANADLYPDQIYN